MTTPCSGQTVEHGLAGQPQGVEPEWVAFNGGELEGARPSRKCGRCTAAERRGQAVPGNARAPLCFQCYREELDRQRALRRAAELDTASEVRFQYALPFEPIDRPRLARLQSERLVARSVASGATRALYRRGRAQIAARRALERLALGLRDHEHVLVKMPERTVRTAMLKAGEVQLPESWLPFVVSQ